MRKNQGDAFNLPGFLESADNRSLLSKAAIMGFLCEDPQQRNPYLDFILAASSSDEWQETLTSMNKVILDGYTLLRPVVRLRFVELLQFFITHNPANLECVLNNFFRELNSGMFGLTSIF